MASFNDSLQSIYANLSQQDPPAPPQASPPGSPRSAPQRPTLFFSPQDQAKFQAFLPRPSPASRPHVTLTYATSLDAALAAAPGVQTALSGPETKAMTHFLRSRHDAILIGVGTALADNPSLNCRLDGVGGYGGKGLQGQPRPVVLDPKGRWKVEGSKVLGLAAEGRGKAPWIITSTPRNGESLQQAGGEYIVVPTEGTGRFEWAVVLAELRKRGIESVMIEGGGAVINSLLTSPAAELVDSVIVTIAPTWLGAGGVVVSPPRETGASQSASPVARLQSPQWHQLGNDVVLCGYLK